MTAFWRRAAAIADYVGISSWNLPIGSVDATEEFIDAVVNNPVLAGWGNQSVVIGAGA